MRTPLDLAGHGKIDIVGRRRMTKSRSALIVLTDDRDHGEKRHHDSHHRSTHDGRLLLLGTKQAPIHRHHLARRRSTLIQDRVGLRLRQLSHGCVPAAWVATGTQRPMMISMETDQDGGNVPKIARVFDTSGWTPVWLSSSESPGFLASRWAKTVSQDAILAKPHLLAMAQPGMAVADRENFSARGRWRHGAWHGAPSLFQPHLILFPI